MTPPRGEGVDRALFWLLAAAHLAACLHYFPPREIFSGEPVLTSDWVQHYFQAVRAAGYLRDGSFLGYCTTWSAGFVDGFVGLVNNKPFTLLLFVTPERFHPLAFNLAVLVSLFAFPPLVYGAARRFGHDRRQASAAMALAIACWYGSMLFRVFWRGGSALFAVGVAVALLSTALLHARWRDDEERPPSLALAALGVAAVPWIHSGAVLVVAVAVGCAYLATLRARGLRLREVLVLGGATLVTSLPWLVPFVGHRALRRSLDYGIYPGGLSHFVHDFFRAPLHWASGPREETAILLPLAVLAALGVRELRRRPGLFPALAASAFVFAGLAYGGRALGLGALQPYRFVIPLAAVFAIAAGAALPKRGVALRPFAAIVAVVALVGVADRLRTTWPSGDYLGAGLGPTERAALAALRETAAPEGGRVDGRILLEGDWFAEPVPGRPRSRRVSYSFVGFEGELDAEFIGAPTMSVVTPQEGASFWLGRLFGRKLEAWTRDDFLALAAAYDVRWAVTLHERSARRLASYAPDVEQVADAGRVAIFRIGGAPRAERRATSDGRTIEFTAADASPAILPYHWNPLLSAMPAAELRPAPAGAAGLHFIELVPPAAGRYRLGTFED